MDESLRETQVCKNCKQEAVGSYCSACGQSTHTDRVNLHYLIHEFLHGVLHVDRGILFTIKELTVRPGETIRYYLEGKRVSYFKPFGYFFILATIYTLLMHLIDIPIIDSEAVYPMDGDAHRNNILLKTGETINSFYSLINERYAIMSLLLLPISAFISFIIFRKAKYNYGEHLVINSYILGHSMLLLIIGIPISYYFTNTSASLYFLSPAMSIMKIYMFSSVFSSYKLIKRVLLSVLYIILEFVVIFILGFVIILAILLIKIYMTS